MFLGRRQPGPYAFVIGMCSRGQRSSCVFREDAACIERDRLIVYMGDTGARLGEIASIRLEEYSPESVPRLSGSMGRLAGGGCRSRQRSTVG